MKKYTALYRKVGLRQLKTRSVIASALLGANVPDLSSRDVIRFCALFGIPEGTVRVTLSRMAASDDLDWHDGRYCLAGRLEARRQRQAESREPSVMPWDGTFQLEVVYLEGRKPIDRAALRTAMLSLRLAEYRTGVWARPNNLLPDRLPEERSLVRSQCDAMYARLDFDPATAVARLWDLGAWQKLSDSLRSSMGDICGDLEKGNPSAIAPGFIVAAAVTHHLMSDPLLPVELTPPKLTTTLLRDEWEYFDATWQRLLRDWFNLESEDSEGDVASERIVNVIGGTWPSR